MSSPRDAARGASGDHRPVTAAPPAQAADRASDRGPERVLPEATVARLAVYLRALSIFAGDGTATVSSDELATAAGVNSAMLRKDLSFLGSYGIRGVGYEVTTLTEQISRTLGVTVNRCVAIVGVGNLGQALAGYGGFASRGFRIAALLDSDPRRVGNVVGGMPVRGLTELPRVIAAAKITIAVLAVPGDEAQQVCDQLVGAGVTSILNFAPVVLSVPPAVDVRKVDLAAELQILSFHETRKAAERASGVVSAMPLAAGLPSGRHR